MLWWCFIIAGVRTSTCFTWNSESFSTASPPFSSEETISRNKRIETLRTWTSSSISSNWWTLVVLQFCCKLHVPTRFCVGSGTHSVRLWHAAEIWMFFCCFSFVSRFMERSDECQCYCKGGDGGIRADNKGRAVVAPECINLSFRQSCALPFFSSKCKWTW